MGGLEVDSKTVMMIPAVSSTVSFLSGAVATLPIRLFHKNADGVEEITDDYRLSLLNRETRDLLDAFQWKESLIRDFLIDGNGYSYIEWDANRISAIYYVNPSDVSVTVGTDPIYKNAQFLIGGVAYPQWKIMRILRNTQDGVTGDGLTQEVRLQMETMLNSLQYENHMVRSGSKKGFLKAKNRLTQDVIHQLKEGWRRLYGNDSEENVVVLNDGIEFQDAGQTAVETQLNENKKTNDHEVYKLSAIVPTLLEGGATKEDRKNTVRFGIAPIAKALETAINRFCLLENEKDSYFFEVDLDALDGTDLLDRYQAYETALRAGWVQGDEIRTSEGLNPLGLNFIPLGLDRVFYNPKTRMIYTPNTKEWTEIGKKGEQESHEN